MTDERAKEIADVYRLVEAGENPENFTPRVMAAFTLKLYDDLQAIKQAMQGLSFLGVGGGIKPVTKTEG